MLRVLSFSFLACLAFEPSSQEHLEALRSLFPAGVGDYKPFEEPQIEKVNVNGEDFFNVVAFYEVDLDHSFSVRLTDYATNPEFITKMVSQLKASQPYEDESEKWVNLEIQGYPSQLEVLKKYPTYSITTFVQGDGKQWLLTFSGNGMTEEESIQLMEAVVVSLVKN